MSIRYKYPPRRGRTAVTLVGIVAIALSLRLSVSLSLVHTIHFIDESILHYYEYYTITTAPTTRTRITGQHMASITTFTPSLLLSYYTVDVPLVVYDFVFRVSDACHTLVCALIILNTNLHNQVGFSYVSLYCICISILLIASRFYEHLYLYCPPRPS